MILKGIHPENEEFLRTNAILTIDIILKGIHSENEFLITDTSSSSYIILKEIHPENEEILRTNTSLTFAVQNCITHIKRFS